MLVLHLETLYVEKITFFLVFFEGKLNIAEKYFSFRK